MRLKGELWRIEDVRKGPMTIRLHSDVSEIDDSLYADLEAGKPSYLANETRIGSPFAGFKPVAGQDAMCFRQCLVRWIEKVDE